MQAELRPGPHLEGFLKGADAAGQGDEGVGQVGHLRLAFMHGRDDAQLGKAPMGDFEVGESFRQHPDRLASAGERGVRRFAHKADRCAAVNKADAAAGQRVAKPARRRPVFRAGAEARSAENANSHPPTRWHEFLGKSSLGRILASTGGGSLT